MRFPTHAFCVTAFTLAAACSLLAQPAARPHLASLEFGEYPRVWAVLDGVSQEEAKEFRLLEDGSITASGERFRRFRDTGIGLALIVAIDVSGSMRGEPLEAIRQGLIGLVARKRSQDPVAVLTFADDTRWEVRWDATEQKTREVFEGLEGRGSKTRMYDAVAAALAEFKTAAKRDSGLPNRRAILVLSDGHDEGSRQTLRDTIRQLEKPGVRMDAIGMAQASPRWFESLKRLTQAGSGEFGPARNAEHLKQLLERGIVEESLDVGRDCCRFRRRVTSDHRFALTGQSCRD